MIDPSGYKPLTIEQQLKPDNLNNLSGIDVYQEEMLKKFYKSLADEVDAKRLNDLEHWQQTDKTRLQSQHGQRPKNSKTIDGKGAGRSRAEICHIKNTKPGK